MLFPLHLGFTAPRLESTVAALAFNRVAQLGCCFDEILVNYFCEQESMGVAAGASMLSEF